MQNPHAISSFRIYNVILPISSLVSGLIGIAIAASAAAAHFSLLLSLQALSSPAM